MEIVETTDDPVVSNGTVGQRLELVDVQEMSQGQGFGWVRLDRTNEEHAP